MQILKLYTTIILFCLLNKAYGQSIDTVWKSIEYNPSEFKNSIPANCPIGINKDLKVLFTGRFVNYSNADTWYPSWASNDTLYSPWTDGYFLRTDKYEPFDDAHPGYACNSLDYLGRKAATAQAAIVGKDPLNLQVDNILPRIDASPGPYGGRYPCGSLVYNNSWYYGTYCLTENMTNNCDGVGWTEMGPFVGFRISHDYGKTWIETSHSPNAPLFKENSSVCKIKIGSPHFVDFGKNMQYSPDGYAYLVASGTNDSSSCNNWIQADNVYLIRVKPNDDNINNSKAYEFYSGTQDGKPFWSKNFSKIEPIISWKGHLGCVTITFNPFLNKYMMCITRGSINYAGANSYRSMILLSDKLDNNWKILTYWEDFGSVGYFLNFPSKFILDKNLLWLCYSSNHDSKNRKGKPEGSHYSLSLHEIRLIENKN
jgi:hypothetical protein